jgi:hypothetical protein
MFRRLALAIPTALLLAFALTGCGKDDTVETPVPTNIEIIQSTEPGASLKSLGYTPIANLERPDTSEHTGHVYVACGETTNITECSNDRHNRGTETHPNVYVKHNLIEVLEGPRSEEHDGNYYVTVPVAARDITKLDAEQRTILLTKLMPAAIAQAKTRDSLTSDVKYAFDLKDLGIGVVMLWISKDEPGI